MVLVARMRSYPAPLGALEAVVVAMVYPYPLGCPQHQLLCDLVAVVSIDHHRPERHE
jgi:hypothetical protein